MTASPDRIQWGFSSLGAPELSLQELADLARRFEMDFLELRAVKGTIDLPKYFHDHPRELEIDSGQVRVLSTSLRLTESADEDIVEFMRFVKLAKTWQTPYLRIFGGGEHGTEISPKALAHAAKTVERCRGLMAEAGSTAEMVLETHSGFSSTKTCRALNELLEQPLSILWDSHHTWKLADESLEESWQTVGPWIRHIHYKDSTSLPIGDSETRYVLPGYGEFPTQDLLQLLARAGYRGGLSLEWEKLWHPNLRDLDEVLGPFKKICG